MQGIIIGLVLLVAGFEVLLEVLDYRHRHTPLPENVKDIFDPKEYQKSLDYTMAKSRYGIVTTSVRALVLAGLLGLGFFTWLNDITESIASDVVLQTLLFLFGFYLVTFVFSVPFKYVQDFVIEERFGFNRMTKKLFVVDLIKSFVLTVIIGGLLLSVAIITYALFTDVIQVFIIVVFFLIATLMLGSFISQGWVIRKFYKLEPLKEGSLKTKIYELSERLGFSVNRIFVMDGSKRSTHMNAFFTGLGKTRQIVLFDTLIEKLTEDQVVAIMAHEIGHAKHKDAPKILTRSLLLVAIYALASGVVLSTEALFTAFGFSGIHLGFALVILPLLLAPIDILYGLNSNAFSRRFEYRADAFAAKHTSKDDLDNALKTIVKESFVNLTPHPWVVKVYHNHPTMSDRLDPPLSINPKV